MVERGVVNPGGDCFNNRIYSISVYRAIQSKIFFVFFSRLSCLPDTEMGVTTLAELTLTDPSTLAFFQNAGPPYILERSRTHCDRIGSKKT